MVAKVANVDYLPAKNVLWLMKVTSTKKIFLQK